MESRIPLPTDNIYKFYALFGLLLFIFSIGASIVSVKSTNEYMFKAYVELEGLKAIESPTKVDETKKALIERMIEVAKADKETFKNWLTGLAALGTALTVIGFGKWQHSIQPLQDELLRLQVEKLRQDTGSECQTRQCDVPSAKQAHGSTNLSERKATSG